jgi:hypothetical protein
MSARAPRRAARLLIAAVAAAALAGLLAGCGDVSWEPEATPVPGSGNLVTEDRTTTDFTRVSVGAGIKVVAKAGAEPKVSLEAQENLLPLITTNVIDGQLVVNVAPPGITTSEPITLTVTAPVIESLALSGGSTGFLESVTDTLNLDAAGGSKLTVIGTVKGLTLATSAGSHAELGELVAENAQVTMSDGSSATMMVTSGVSGTASGGSTLVLVKPPASMTVSVSGGASVQGG